MICNLMVILLAIVGAFSFPDCAGDREITPARVTFIALDGADWDVIDPLIQEGLLPNFGRIIEGGTRADLVSLGDEWVFQPEKERWGTSPALWMSAATSKLPEEHGITDFIVRDGDVTFPITSNFLRATPVWDIIGGTGKKVAVVGWWATWPAVPVNGYVVSDHVGISRWDLSTTYRQAGFEIHADTYPASLLDELRHLQRTPGDISARDAMKLCGIDRITRGLEEGNKLFELKIAIAADITYCGASFYIMDTYRPDFLTVYIEGIDIVQHLFWKYMPEEAHLFEVDPVDVENLGKVVPTYHMLVDSLLGEFLGRIGEEDRLVIASDHGFHASRARQHIHISGEHDRRGILLLYGGGIRQGAVLDELSLLDLAPMILYMEGMPIARDMKGKVPLDAFTAEVTGGKGLAFVDTYETREKGPLAPVPIPSPADSHLLEKLEALGYITRN